MSSHGMRKVILKLLCLHTLVPLSTVRNLPEVIKILPLWSSEIDDISYLHLLLPIISVMCQSYMTDMTYVLPFDPLITGNAVHCSRQFVSPSFSLLQVMNDYGQVCIEPSSWFCAVPRLLTTSCYILSYLLLRHLRKRYRERTFWAGIRRGKPNSQYM